jgi:hypothetical protein
VLDIGLGECRIVDGLSDGLSRGRRRPTTSCSERAVPRWWPMTDVCVRARTSIPKVRSPTLGFDGPTYHPTCVSWRCRASRSLPRRRPAPRSKIHPRSNRAGSPGFVAVAQKPRVAQDATRFQSPCKEERPTRRAVLLDAAHPYFHPDNSPRLAGFDGPADRSGPAQRMCEYSPDLGT